MTYGNTGSTTDSTTDSNTPSGTPAATTVVELPDGRMLALAEHGSTGGHPVVFLHSAPGSRAFDPDPAATAAAGIRLITIDRPGYGASTALHEGSLPTVAGMADDIAFALHGLGIERSSIVGWSAGGRVAMGLAARHGDLASSVALVGTPAPDDEVPWIPDAQRQQLHAMRADPRAGYLMLAQMLAGMVADVAADPAAATSLIAGTAADREVLRDVNTSARLTAMLVEAFRPGAFGAAADIVASEATPWGFDVADVVAPLTTFYGAADSIPLAAGAWYADRVPNAVSHVVPGAGHLVVVTNWRDILASVTR